MRDYNGAERLILEGISVHSSSFEEICRSISSEAIQPSLSEGVSQVEGAYESARELPSVLALDLVNRRDGVGGSNLRDSIHIHVKLYSPPPLLDPLKNPELLIHPARRQALRDWRNGGDRVARIELPALRPLIAPQRKYGLETMASVLSNDEVGAFYANWFILLRFNQAVASAALPLNIPIICGVELESRPMEVNLIDYTPHFEALHLRTV